MTITSQYCRLALQWWTGHILIKIFNVKIISLGAGPKESRFFRISVAFLAGSMDAKYSRYYLFSSVSLMLYKELLFLTEVSIM
jgi:hypothetical protein